MTYYYSAYHMKVISEFPLPLPHYCESEILQEVFVKKGNVEDVEETYKENTFQFGYNSQGFLIISIPNYARMRIEYNRLIVVDNCETSKPHIVSACITSIALVVIIKSHNVITFHGSAVVHNQKAYMILGNQGSGKSTTATSLVSHGCQMLCDDIIPFLPPMVLSGIPRAKLLDDAFTYFKGTIENSSHLFDGIDKYQIEVHHTFQKTPLSKIFILETEHVDSIEFTPLTGSDKTRAIMSHLSVVKNFEHLTDIFHRTITSIATISVIRITRPKHQFTLEHITEKILSNIHT